MAKDAQLAAGRVLVVGLGNPGSKYDGTRHNVGFEVASILAREHGIDVSTSKFKGQVGTGSIEGRSVSILMPTTYMNLSGESAVQAATFWRVPPEGVIAIHDDLDLELGRVRIKLGGGHGGHNGLRSLDTHLPSKEYFRIRLGIGRPHGNVSGWVLGRFSAEEREVVDGMIPRGADAVRALIREGLQAAQNRVHAPV